MLEKIENLFKGKKTKKEIFSLIAIELNKSCQKKVTGDQCLRKGKAGESVERSTRPQQNKWKWSKGLEVLKCLQKDLTVNHFSLNITQQSSADNDDNEDESDKETVM